MELQFERFAEALGDESTGLTYAALTRGNKQSVRVAERFSGGVFEFMKEKKYVFEERFVQTAQLETCFRQAWSE